jgi:flagellar basal-body rod protein FlgB
MVFPIRTGVQPLLEQALDGHYARQQAIASNLANVETPGYRRHNVSFEESLQQQLEKNKGSVGMTGTTRSSFGRGGMALIGEEDMALSESLPLTTEHPRHLDIPMERSNPAIRWSMEAQWASRNDNNGVDVESEMVALQKNAGKFKSLSTLQGRMNQQLKQLISSSAGG